MRVWPDNAGVCLFGVADFAGFVQFLWWDKFGPAHLFRRGKAALAVSAHLSPLLRRVVLVGKTALGLRFDFQRVGLRTMRGDRLQDEGNGRTD